MGASFPTSVWSGVSQTRTNLNTRRAPDGHDWQRLVDEIRALEKLLDSIGVSTAGAFATADPDTGKRLWANTLVLTLGGATTAEPLTNVWDKTTRDRVAAEVDQLNAPTPGDWSTLKDRVVALQKRVQPLGIPATGVLPASEPTTGGYLWKNTATVTVSNEVGAHTNSLWDGTSPSRSDADVNRAPDSQDYEKAAGLVRAMMNPFQLFGFDADGGLPTSDPSVSGELYTDTLVVKVSA